MAKPPTTIIRESKDLIDMLHPQPPGGHNGETATAPHHPRALADSHLSAAPTVNPVLRLFSNIWFGIILLTLILAYACVFSAVAAIRGAMEMTEMEAFSHWSFATLVILFCITMIVTTLRRIRLNTANLGVWTVHTGLLLLTGGSVYYFSTKIEGDVFLPSPAIELLTTSGQKVPRAEVPAEAGQAWENFMPALGGAVRFDVLETKSAGMDPVAEARVRVKVGEAAPVEVALNAQSEPTKTVSERLAVRLRTFPQAGEFYDNDTVALHYRKVGNPGTRLAVIEGLPLHRERFLEDATPILDRHDKPVESNRTWPHVSLLGIPIPTGWFEHWRLPIPLDIPELPFDVEVTGYLPYISGFVDTAIGGGDRENPGINFTITAGTDSVAQTLLAGDPRRSLLTVSPPIEFVWAADAAERERLLAPLAAAHELYVEIKDPPVTRTLVITPGKTIEIEGTPYKLTINELRADWPMMTPGFEGAISPVAQVAVTNGRKSYTRTVVQRFPQLSQDIDEQGVRHREGPYDPNIVMRYRSSPAGWLTIVAGPDEKDTPVLAYFDRSGQVTRHEVVPGKKLSLPLALQRIEVGFTLTGLYRNARLAHLPVVEPVETRRPNMFRELSAIRLKLTGKGPHADWSETRWVAFSRYPDLEARPIVVQLPGDSTQWELIYSRQPHSLGGKLALKKLGVEFFPGRDRVRSWRSDFLALADGASAPVSGEVYTNQTFSFGRWTFYQATAANDHWSFTGLGVGNRNGIWPMILGSCFIPLGCLYAFYVKPVIRRRQAERLRAAATSRTPLSRGKQPKRELVEVG